jgi:hypothetical protein
MSRRNFIGLALLLVVMTILKIVNNRTDRLTAPDEVMKKINAFTSSPYYKQKFPDVVLTSSPDPAHGAILEASGKVTDEKALREFKSWMKDDLPFSFHEINEYRTKVEQAPAFKSKPMLLVEYKLTVGSGQTK